MRLRVDYRTRTRTQSVGASFFFSLSLFLSLSLSAVSCFLTVKWRSVYTKLNTERRRKHQATDSGGDTSYMRRRCVCVYVSRGPPSRAAAASSQTTISHVTTRKRNALPHSLFFRQELENDIDAIERFTFLLSAAVETTRSPGHMIINSLFPPPPPPQINHKQTQTNLSINKQQHHKVSDRKSVV